MSDTVPGSVNSPSTFSMTKKKFKGGIAVKEKGTVVDRRAVLSLGLLKRFSCHLFSSRIL